MCLGPTVEQLAGMLSVSKPSCAEAFSSLVGQADYLWYRVSAFPIPLSFHTNPRRYPWCAQNISVFHMLSNYAIEIHFGYTLWCGKKGLSRRLVS